MWVLCLRHSAVFKTIKEQVMPEASCLQVWYTVFKLSEVCLREFCVCTVRTYLRVRISSSRGTLCFKEFYTHIYVTGIIRKGSVLWNYHFFVPQSKISVLKCQLWGSRLSTDSDGIFLASAGKRRQANDGNKSKATTDQSEDWEKKK